MVKEGDFPHLLIWGANGAGKVFHPKNLILTLNSHAVGTYNLETRIIHKLLLSRQYLKTLSSPELHSRL